ncbi:hypothetical protein GX408_15730 [bacterium]|nr:hypothetical protein [bacterium]
MTRSETTSRRFNPERARGTILVLAACVLGNFIFCRKHVETSRVVARLNDSEITSQDFIDQFKLRHPELTLSQAEPSVKQRVLQDMIDQQIILMEAYRLGYDRDAEVRAFLTEKEQELAAQAYLDKEIKLEPINDTLCREYYRWMHKVYDVSFIRIGLGLSDQEKEAAGRKAQEIYRLLQSGADFRRTAATRSEHSTAVSDSGKYSLVTCFNLEKPVIQQLFTMKPGMISEPIEVSDAFFIVRLEKVTEQKPAEYSIVRPEILEELNKRHQTIRAQKTARLEAALKRQYHYAILPNQVDLFCSRTKKMKSRSDTLNLFTAREKQLPLSRTDFNVITIGEFLPKVVEYYWDSLSQKRVVEMLLNHMNGKRILKHHAMQQQLNKSPEVEQKLQVLLTQTLKERVVAKEVLAKIPTSDADLQPYYEKLKTNFRIPPQATVQEIFCRTKAEIDRVHALSVSRDFAGLQAAYSQDQETRTNGILGPFAKGRHGRLGELAFSGMRVGEISEPFAYRGGYSFFKLLALTPERIEPFSAVREKIKQAYLDEHKERYTAEWLQAARKQYRIQTEALP